MPCRGKRDLISSKRGLQLLGLLLLGVPERLHRLRSPIYSHVIPSLNPCAAAPCAPVIYLGNYYLQKNLSFTSRSPTIWTSHVYTHLHTCTHTSAHTIHISVHTQVHTQVYTHKCTHTHITHHTLIDFTERGLFPWQKRPISVAREAYFTDLAEEELVGGGVVFFNLPQILTSQ